MKRQILFVAYYYAKFLLCLCFCISSVNWCTYVVLISLPPFDILIAYACTYSQVKIGFDPKKIAIFCFYAISSSTRSTE